MQFQKAERKKSKLRLALSGVSGSGKTFSALKVAKGIADGINGKIAVIDTERGSASLYNDICNFDVLELDPPYTPENYIAAIHAAKKANYDVLIIDSLTHEWNGKGGILETVDIIARTKFRGNSYAAWSELTPRHSSLIEAMLKTTMHLIVTMRSKSSYVETEEKGRKVIKKQGTEPQQRDGMEFEFTSFLEISKDGNYAIADHTGKDRTRLFKEPVVLSEATGKLLLDWLNEGKDNPDLMILTEKQKSVIIDYMSALNYSFDQMTKWFGKSVESFNQTEAEDIIARLNAAYQKQQETLPPPPPPAPPAPAQPVQAPLPPAAPPAPQAPVDNTPPPPMI
jgi:hypothetical protein